MQAGYELFDLPQEFIDLTFGVVTIVTSVIATLLGGLFIDMVGSSVKNAMAFCGWTALVSIFFLILSFGRKLRSAPEPSEALPLDSSNLQLITAKRCFLVAYACSVPGPYHVGTSPSLHYDR